MIAQHRTPEQTSYVDNGCDIAPRCLACPLPRCRYDLPPRRAGALLRWLAVEALLGEGRTAAEVADELGMSRRTVFRLKRYAAAADELVVLPRE